MLCPSCSAASLDAYGRCPHCGYSAVPPAQPYASYYQQPALITPTAPAGVGLAAQILIAVSGLIAVVAFGVNIWAYTVAKTGFDTGGSNYDAMNAAAGVAGLFIFFSYLLCLATGIVFIVWFFKSARLAAILAPGQQGLAAGWAVGGWFIPLAYLVLPRIVAGGIWRSAVPLEAVPTGRRPRTYLVTAWWLTFIVGQLLLVVAVNPTRGDSANSDTALVIDFGLSGIVDLCRIASAILGIIMIRKITSMQQIRILQGPGVGHPYAAPTVANAPYAAYVDPQAPGYPGAPYPYAAPAGTPYAGAQQQPAQPYATPPVTAPVPQAFAQPVAQPAAQPVAASDAQPVPQPLDAVPTPTPYEPSVPPQAAAPREEAAPAAPAERPTLVEPAESAAPQDAAPAAGPAAEPTDAEPTDGEPVDRPTAVIPRQAKEQATAALAAIPAPAAPVDAAPAQATAAAGAASAADAPQDAVPAEPRDA